MDCFPLEFTASFFEEFEKRFVYFDRSDRRYRLFDKLRELYFQAKNSGIIERFLIGGSFVTSKPEPNDFDCILVYDPALEDRVMWPWSIICYLAQTLAGFSAAK